MKYDDDFLLRYDEERLASDERLAFETALSQNAGLRASLDAVVTARRGLRTNRANAFKPFFAERVLQRLRPAENPELSLYLSLRWAFVRASAVAAVVALLLAGINAGTYGELDIASSILNTAFGIPEASPIDAWTYTGITADMHLP